MRKILILLTLAGFVISLSAVSFGKQGGIAELSKQERKELKIRKERALKNCDLTALGKKTKKKCRKDAKNRYQKNLSDLAADPEKYFNE